MRPDCVVVFPPFLDHDLSLFQAVKDLAVEQFIPEPGVGDYDAACRDLLRWSLVGSRNDDEPDREGDREE